jgi:hypothetical protein
MNLEITSFADAGVYEGERIVLRARTDLDVGEFVVFRSGVGLSGGPTSGRKWAYWFPDQKVHTNDLVVLYTKKGSRRSKSLPDGSTVYFFYWGRDEAFWGDSNFGAVVLEVLDWKFKVPGR